MKSVLRSCFDPLPRIMSTKSLAGLVVMVLLGTGLSVYEYLESSHLPVRAGSSALDATPDRDGMQRPGCCPPTDRYTTFRDSGYAEQPAPKSGPEQVSECTKSVVSEAPSLFEPPVEHAGS